MESGKKLKKIEEREEVNLFLISFLFFGFFICVQVFLVLFRFFQFEFVYIGFLIKGIENILLI